MVKLNATSMGKGATAHIDEKTLRASNMKPNDEFYTIAGDQQIIIKKMPARAKE